MSGLLSHLAAKSRLTVADTAQIVETAHLRYRVYPIPKRNGGERVIAHPARELKVVQRVLVEYMRDDLAVHDCVAAYEKGCSIVKNAGRHRGAKWLGKLDIRNFFNSINPAMWTEYLVSERLSPEIIDISSKVFFWKPRLSNGTCLSVGAPSSPFVSNRVMYKFDNAINEYCKNSEIVFTRYADDMTFSSSEHFDFSYLSLLVQNELEKIGGLNINSDKSRYIGPGGRKSVTGLILANDGRVTLGRSRRRQIEAMVHNFVREPHEQEASKVRGHVAFLKIADRAAYDRLKGRFGGFAAAGAFSLFSE